MDERRSTTPSPAHSDQSRTEPGAPHEHEVREQLDRILHSTTFRDSLRLTRFLAFVVEATLAGNADRIKAYTIAVEALERGVHFDPQADPIVRVEAGRLRCALSRYYSGAGSGDPVAIDLPRGTYVPTFGRQNIQAPPHPDIADRFTEQDGGSDLITEIIGRSRQLSQALMVFQELMAIQQQQIAAVAAQIENTRQSLLNSRTVLQVGDKACLACRPVPLLLPTAPSPQSSEVGPADGQQEPRSQETQGAPAAWTGRPRSGRNRRDAADDGNDPPSVRTLRLRAR